jgi:hypothetical protein
MAQYEALQIGPRIRVLPVVNGSGDFAVAVKRMMLEGKHDCLAIPLPASFQHDVEQAIELLPVPSVVLQQAPDWASQWQADEEESEFDGYATYVPIDPCQPVIAAIRAAMGERIPRRFIDLERIRFEPYSSVFPDPYPLKKTTLERFSAAILPSIQRPEPGQRTDRITHIARELRELSIEFKSILLVCSILDWPWIREAYFDPSGEVQKHETVAATEAFAIDPKTLLFLLGEFPFVTGLYERARAELDNDEQLSIDGVKELLIAARDDYRSEMKGRARKITPHLLSTCLKYIRNLQLISGRFTPDVTTIVEATQQVFGDQYALSVLHRANVYPYTSDTGLEIARMGIDKIALPSEDVLEVVSRLPGPPFTWKSIRLKPKPEKCQQDEWRHQWNPYSQCSWPPEDELIENFRATVMNRALQVLGADLAKTEKFTTSIKDGIDIRDTLRNWFTGDIYVKELPPSCGMLDAAVMLFDAPADPRDYPWRSTWYAEHENESTLAFFATDFQNEPVGPGICLANYGGAMFLFPPRAIPDIWTDHRLDFVETLEDRLIAAACLHSTSRSVALLSALPPGAGWRKLAKQYGRSLIHLPLAQFSDSTIQQLRYLHVLNGHQVRSYAADFIRRA